MCDTWEFLFRGVTHRRSEVSVTCRYNCGDMSHLGAMDMSAHMYQVEDDVPDHAPPADQVA